MSNRILGKLISNRFQQTVLGFYIGTIVYALFLLSTIRDVNSGIHVPAISTYFLITLTIIDIFLFIYFLHYITNSVRFETIIHRIYDDTKHVLKKNCEMEIKPANTPQIASGLEINAFKSGRYQGFEKDRLLDLCKKEDVVVSFKYAVGTYVIHGSPLLLITHDKEVSKDFEEKINVLINIGKGQEISTSFYYGFRQLMEIAIKALSPGINDPGTATIALQCLADLFAYRLQHLPKALFYDKNGVLRIITKEKTFEEIFKEYFLPIWDYGKNDRLMQQEILHILKLLKKQKGEPVIDELLLEVEAHLKTV
jgi:uncharacterized membrane protein